MQRRRKTTKEERVCSICSQGFAKAEHLDRHFRSHTKEKPFACAVCDKKFARQDTLLRHSRSHETSRATLPLASPSIHDGDDSDTSRMLETASSDRDRTGPQMMVDVPMDQVPLQHQTPSVAGHHPRDSIMSDEFTPGGATIQPPPPHQQHQQQLPPPPQPTDPYASMGAPIDPSLGMPPVDVFDHHGTPGSGGQQHYGWLPQWDAEMSLDAQWLADLAADKLDATGMDFFMPPPSNAPGTHPDQEYPRWMQGASQPTPDSDVTPDLTSMSNLSNFPGRTAAYAQRKWHTFTEQEPTGYNTPDLSQDRFRVDEMCHQNLADRLKPRVLDGPIPSTRFLNLAIQAYFANFHPIFPIIHAPSFRPHSQNGLLLLSICSVGSLFLGSNRATAHGVNIFERLHKALLSSWDSHISSQKLSNTLAFQASILGQMFGLMMGRPKDLVQVEFFHGTLIAWSRRMRLSDTDDSMPDVTDLNGPELDAAWKDWIRKEEKKRTMLALFLQDADIAAIFHHDPLLRQAPNLLPRISSREVFSAPNSRAWKSALMSQASYSTRLASQDSQSQARHQSRMDESPDFGPGSSIEFPESTTNDFELQVMLARIGAVACECRGATPSTSPTARHCQDLLISWHKRYRQSAAFQRQAASLMMLWHSVYMTLHMDIDKLERFCGRDGPGVAESVRTEAQAWAQSDDARATIVHAILAQRHFECIPVGEEPPLHFPACLYRCGIAWHCYANLGERATTQNQTQSQQSQSRAPTQAPAGLDLPELRALGIDGSKLLSEEAGLMDGRPAASSLFKIIHLLQCTSHRKLAHNLAATLLAIVEEGQEVF